MFIIYALQDPRNKEIRYVGKSTKGLKRPQQHLLPCYYLAEKHKKTPVYIWINKLIRLGLSPNIIVLQTLSEYKELNYAEVYWLNYFKNNNSPLLNVVYGSSDGSLNYIFSKEQKLKFSTSRIGRKQPERFRSFMKDYWTKNKGQNSTEEFRQKVSAGTKLWWSSLENTLRDKLKANLKKGGENRKRLKDSNGNFFKSYTEAASFYNCSISAITYCIKNKRPFRKNIIFEVTNG